ncbi:MAG: hypothetical protein WA688_04490 [Thermoplasmata archaeon]
MGQLRDALGAVCPEIEGRATARLTANPAEGLHKWLPQSWGFETETESATLNLDADGRATATEGIHGPVDRSVNWSQADLLEVLTAATRSTSFKRKNPLLRIRTPNGQRAFCSLRGAIGL